MATTTTKIIQKSIEILESNPEGVRFSNLVGKIEAALPEVNPGSIPATLMTLVERESNKVYKPARGLYRHTKYREEEIAERETVPTRMREEEFYQSFAEFLIGGLDECTKAIALGGKKFMDKWGTPDVLGILTTKPSDIYKPPIEIVSAEIKIDTYELIKAFGQACAYMLFSHKSYIVIPKKSAEEDITRLDSLCQIFGIGLILFDSENKDNPQFEIKVRPRKHEPDMFYINKYLKLIETELFD